MSYKDTFADTLCAAPQSKVEGQEARVSHTGVLRVVEWRRPRGTAQGTNRVGRWLPTINVSKAVQARQVTDGYRLTRPANNAGVLRQRLNGASDPLGEPLRPSRHSRARCHREVKYLEGVAARIDHRQCPSGLGEGRAATA
jgi:hypothetical protein